LAFLDIDSTFSLNSVGDLNIVRDKDAINQALRNIILTPSGFRPGEYTDNSTYGIGIKEYLFQKANPFTADSIKDTLRRKIDRYEPRIQLIDITVTPVNGLTYEIYITYYLVAGSREKNEYKLVLDRL
jgi:phage baseplate assembly protein W